MMGSVMPNEAGRNVGVGERLSRTRRLWFWGTLAGLFVLSGVAGFVTGFTEPREGWLPILKSMPWLVYLGLGALVASFVAGSWLFFRQVDELEVADNLWASMLGLYVYAVLLPVWWALWTLDMASEPDQWAIYAATLIAAAVVYIYRKLRLR